MEFALLQLLFGMNAFGMNAFGMTTGNPISVYRFDVNPVERCPMNATEFETAARKRNCTGNNRYLCAPDRNLSNLIEFCTDTKRSLFEKGNCLRLEGTGDLNHYRCVERFVSGCPTGPYTDEEIYNYTSCLELNLDLNCFVADKNCQKRLLTTTEFFFNDSKDEATTDKYFNDSTDGDVLKNAEPETYDGSNKLQIAIFVVYGFLFVAILTGSVAFHFYKKGKHLDDEEYKNKRKGEDEKKLRDFLRRKEITVRHARGIIVGCGGAGKTTLLKRLANANYNDLKKIKPTRYVDVHVNKFVVTNEGKMIPREEKDKDQTTIKIPADVIYYRDINQSIETDIEETDVSIEIGDDKDFSSNIQKTKQEGWGEYSENRATSEHNESLQNRSKQENKELQPSSDEMLLEDNEINNENNDKGMEGDGYETFAVSEIMDYVKAMSGTDYLGPQITFLDFAGQKFYYSYHQIYLSPGTFYILVVDMTKKLDEKVESPETNEKGCTRFESWTYKDYYKFWLQSIEMFSDERSPVIVVGTHADKIEETVSNRFFAEFFGLFPHYKCPELYQHLHKDRKFAIGFPKKGVEMEDLKDLKKCIAELVNSDKHSKESCSPVWGIFEQYLLKVKEKEKRKIITRGNLLAFNETLPKENRIHDDEITKLLKFLNKAGTVLFFEEKRLKETIILDFQWFLDAFKCIINYDVDLDTPSDSKREHFQLTGELEDEELNAIWKKCPNGEDYFKNKDKIIAYMEQLGLLAKCYSRRPYCNETPWYFVPSMRKGKFEKTSIKMYTGSTILCFEFEKKQLPKHVFYGVVFQCFKIPKWFILTSETGQLCLYENMAGFLFHGIVVLICVCKNQIQVQTYRKKDNNISLSLNTEIQNEVSKIIKGLEKYPSSVGYKCENGVFNDENDLSFFSKESLSASPITCKTCEYWHDVDMSVCWIRDQVEKGEERDKDQTTIKIPADVIYYRDINQSIETDIEETDVSIEIGDDKGRESTEEEKKAIVTVMPSDSELIGHRGNNMKQRPTTGKETLEPEKEKREIKDKANSVSTRLANTRSFSKGTHNQTCVLSSYIKAEVSRSVGLIYIDNKPAGTGFRVGEMYIAACAHVIVEVGLAGPHFIACDRMAIEFDRKKLNQRVDTFQVFHFRDISYLDEEHDFVVLELSCHQAGVGFPPPLTCFGEVALSEIYLVGHPNGREMKEDDIFPYWSTEHENKIKELGNWSIGYFPDKMDYYSILLEPPRKILFDTTFNHGASGSPGVTIRDDKPCVVLIFAGGTPKFIFDNPDSTLQVQDHQKVEYGFPISDIFIKMWNSPQQNVKDLASNIFTKFL